jgi:hypothetical protein
MKRVLASLYRWVAAQRSCRNEQAACKIKGS